jgi:hypothetical protein
MRARRRREPAGGSRIRGAYVAQWARSARSVRQTRLAPRGWQSSARARQWPTSAPAARTRCNPGRPARPGRPLGRPPRNGWRTRRPRDRSPGRRARCPRRVGLAWSLVMRACQQPCRRGHETKCCRAPISRWASTVAHKVDVAERRPWVHARTDMRFRPHGRGRASRRRWLAMADNRVTNGLQVAQNPRSGSAAKAA